MPPKEKTEASQAPLMAEPKNLTERIEALESKVNKIYRYWHYGVGFGVAVVAITGYHVFALPGKIDDVVVATVPGMVSSRTEEVVQDQLARLERQLSTMVDGRIADSVSITVNRQLNDLVPSSTQLAWLVRKKGGNITRDARGMIEGVDLQDTQIMDSDLATLVSTPGFRSVRVLDLSRTRVTLKSARLLTKFSSIVDIDFSGTSLDPDDAREVFRKSASSDPSLRF